MGKSLEIVGWNVRGWQSTPMDACLYYSENCGSKDMSRSEIRFVFGEIVNHFVVGVARSPRLDDVSLLKNCPFGCF